MKKILLAFLAAFLCGATSIQAQENDMKNILIAYYSWSGNTKQVAEAIQEKIGGELFEIKTVDNYPEDYQDMVNLAKDEISEGFRPELETNIGDISEYDVIFIGSPNWWGTIAPPVSSFLANNDFSGKTVIPVITHGGGREQNTVSDMKKQCSGCQFKKAWTGYGNQTDGLDAWLTEIGFEE